MFLIHWVPLPTPPTPAWSFPSQQPWLCLLLWCGTQMTGLDHGHGTCTAAALQTAPHEQNLPGTPGPGSSGGCGRHVSGHQLIQQPREKQMKKGHNQAEIQSEFTALACNGRCVLKKCQCWTGQSAKLGPLSSQALPWRLRVLSCCVTHGQGLGWLLLWGRNGTQSPWVCLQGTPFSPLGLFSCHGYSSCPACACWHGAIVLPWCVSLPAGKRQYWAAGTFTEMLLSSWRAHFPYIFYILKY